MYLCKETDCTGCSACANICPKSAIKIQHNKYGAMIPVIEKEKCINCGACQQVCPVMHPVRKFETPEVYAAWSKDSDVVRNSASAGVVTTLSKMILSKGGVVFGTCYKDGELIFDYIEKLEQFSKFQGSKYIQAAVGISFRKVKEFLTSDRIVLFVGTPCQVAGLKNYLRRDYENLLTVDLICHGVVSECYLQEYMKEILKNKKYDKVLFRGAEGEKTVAYYNDKIVYKKNKLEDEFFSAYAKGLIHRENCYFCQYTSKERVSDLTAGDFWGICKDRLDNDASQIPYISLILQNSQKGKLWLEDAKRYLVIEQRTLEEAMEGNHQLSEPCKRHKDREQFLSGYLEKGFMKAVKSTSINRQVKKNQLYYGCLRNLKKIKDWMLMIKR